MNLNYDPQTRLHTVQLTNSELRTILDAFLFAKPGDDEWGQGKQVELDRVEAPLKKAFNLAVK